MRFGRHWCALLALTWLLAPRLASGTPDLRAIDGFLGLSLATSTACDGPGDCVAVEVSAPVDVLLFDLQLRWDPGYWDLDAIQSGGVTPGVVERDDAQGFIDDLFGDVGLDPPIAAGAVLFGLVFEVTGSGAIGETVLEIGDLSGFDAFFDRPVLVADAGFDPLPPTPNAEVVIPEPATALLAGLGLLGLAVWRRTERTR